MASITIRNIDDALKRRLQNPGCAPRPVHGRGSARYSSIGTGHRRDTTQPCSIHQGTRCTDWWR